MIIVFVQLLRIYKSFVFTYEVFSAIETVHIYQNMTNQKVLERVEKINIWTRKKKEEKCQVLTMNSYDI